MKKHIDSNKFIQLIFIEPSELPSFGIRYSNSHRLKLENESLFPKRRYLSPQKPVYVLSELKLWIEERVAAYGGSDHE